MSEFVALDVETLFLTAATKHTKSLTLQVMYVVHYTGDARSILWMDLGLTKKCMYTDVRARAHTRVCVCVCLCVCVYMCLRMCKVYVCARACMCAVVRLYVHA